MKSAIDVASRVLSTKLHPPRLPAEVVPRARLIARVQAGLGLPLTLICAPGGFGKTVLLTTALAESARPVAWLSLGADDSHLPTFLQSLVAAIQQTCPVACHATLGLLRRPTLPSPAASAAALRQDLADLPEDLVLVLDEYHWIDGRDVHALLGALLRQPVPRLHLVAATRQPPPWPITRLRATEGIAELGPDDLRFTDDDTQALLAVIVRAQVAEHSAAAIHALLREVALLASDRVAPLGIPSSFVTAFVDRGPAPPRLLPPRAPRDDAEEYVDSPPAGRPVFCDWPTPPVPHREAMWPDLTEPLTARELEVLDLLDRRLSNKEIATTLHVSWQTVAKHTNNIYQKLRVTRRRDAVTRAEALGILAPTGGGADSA
jgi:ATP/maltotriose-dependent transcriptional regulator MalT